MNNRHFTDIHMNILLRYDHVLFIISVQRGNMIPLRAMSLCFRCTACQSFTTSLSHCVVSQTRERLPSQQKFHKIVSHIVRKDVYIRSWEKTSYINYYINTAAKVIKKFLYIASLSARNTQMNEQMIIPIQVRSSQTCIQRSAHAAGHQITRSCESQHFESCLEQLAGCRVRASPVARVELHIRPTGTLQRLAGHRGSCY